MQRRRSQRNIKEEVKEKIKDEVKVNKMDANIELENFNHEDTIKCDSNQSNKSNKIEI